MADADSRPAADAASSYAPEVFFIECGTHKTISPTPPSTRLMSGKIRVSDQRTIDALREAFEKTGWTVTDAVA